MFMYKNKTIRNSFLEYYERNYHPNVGMIADEIKLSRISLNNFKNGKDLNEDSLKKIDKFLKNQMVI